MHTEILTPAQLEILEKIQESGGVPFYLAGGTALALLLGHRKSVDFDFFCEENFNEDDFNQNINGILPGFQRVRQAPRTLLGTWKDVSVSFFQYRYLAIAPSIATPWNLSLASLEDIAAMKLEAIGGRGSRKDFVDLYFLLKAHFTLEQVFAFFAQKFQGLDYDPYHRLRSLSYFEEADQQPMPEMLLPLDWTETKAFFSSEVRRLWGMLLP